MFAAVVAISVVAISLAAPDACVSTNIFLPNQPIWTLEEIDVAFQMDGDYAQQPYNVWLDEVTLTAN